MFPLDISTISQIPLNKMNEMSLIGQCDKLLKKVKIPQTYALDLSYY